MSVGCGAQRNNLPRQHAKGPGVAGGRGALEEKLGGYPADGQARLGALLVDAESVDIAGEAEVGDVKLRMSPARRMSRAVKSRWTSVL